MSIWFGSRTVQRDRPVPGAIQPLAVSACRVLSLPHHRIPATSCFWVWTGLAPRLAGPARLVTCYGLPPRPPRSPCPGSTLPLQALPLVAPGCLPRRALNARGTTPGPVRVRGRARTGPVGKATSLAQLPDYGSMAEPCATRTRPGHQSLPRRVQDQLPTYRAARLPDRTSSALAVLTLTAVIDHYRYLAGTSRAFRFASLTNRVATGFEPAASPGEGSALPDELRDGTRLLPASRVDPVRVPQPFLLPIQDWGLGQPLPSRSIAGEREPGVFSRTTSPGVSPFVFFSAVRKKC